MSETDDRMERAERIRRMRQSRERGEDEDAGNEDAGDEDGGDVETGDEDAEDVDAEVDRAERTASEASSTDASPGTSTESPDSRADAPAGSAATDAAAQDVPGAGLAPLGGDTGFSLPDQDDTASDHSEVRGTASATTEPSVRVLEFTVGEQVYGIEIERVEEIVKREGITRVPNTDAHVEGVVDLRGQITTILDTKRLLDVEESGRESLLVIFAPDGFEEHGTVGWVVDEVRQVVPVVDSQVRTPPSDDDHVRGIVDREDEDELVVWIRPGDTMTRAVDDGDIE